MSSLHLQDNSPGIFKEFLEKMEVVTREFDTLSGSFKQVQQSTSKGSQESSSQNSHTSMAAQHLVDACSKAQSSLQAHVEDMRTSYAITSDIDKQICELKQCLKNHRSLLSSTSSLSGSQLEVDHQNLLQENKNCRQNTSKCREELKRALRTADDSNVTVPSFLSSESESTFQEEDELMRQSQNWEEELSTRCEQWRVFKDQLREFTSCSEDLYNQLIIGIDSRPIGMFLEDLGAFGEQLKNIQTAFVANCKLLPDLERGQGLFLSGSTSEVKDFRSAFAAARSQTEETEDKLKEYFERLKSWDEYFRLEKNVLSWIQPFREGVAEDIQDFSCAKETADPSKMVKRFWEHLLTMAKNEHMVYGVRDFPLSLCDVAAEKDSVKSILENRDTLVRSFEELKTKLQVASEEAEAKVEKWRIQSQEGALKTLPAEKRSNGGGRHICSCWECYFLVIISICFLFAFLLVTFDWPRPFIN